MIGCRGASALRSYGNLRIDMRVRVPFAVSLTLLLLIVSFVGDANTYSNVPVAIISQWSWIIWLITFFLALVSWIRTFANLRKVTPLIFTSLGLLLPCWGLGSLVYLDDTYEQSPFSNEWIRSHVVVAMMFSFISTLFIASAITLLGFVVKDTIRYYRRS